MKNIIGIRVSPTCIYYSILECVDNEAVLIRDVSTINIPTMLDIPNQLTFIRTTLSTIILEYDVEMAGIRLNEQFAKTPSHFRINIEGVIQELFANSSISSYYCGMKNTIAKTLSVSVKDVEGYHNGTIDFMDIDNWNKDYCKEERESIVIAFATLKNGGVYIA